MLYMLEVRRCEEISDGGNRCCFKSLGEIEERSSFQQDNGVVCPSLGARSCLRLEVPWLELLRKAPSAPRGGDAPEA